MADRPRPGRLAAGSLPATVLLLALPLAAPDAGLVATLRGDGRIEAELRQARANGYYEGLIDGATGPSQGRDGSAAGDEQADVQPPPGWVAFADSGIVATVPEFVRWRMHPFVDVEWNGASFRTNSRGYRTPEVAIPKPPGVFRIVVLGSSNTLGHGVDDGDAYPRLLENWLNSAPSGLDRRFEVVNLAVSGDSPTQQLARFRSDVAAYEPDWVLTDATVLDFSLEEMHLQAIVRSGQTVPFPFVRAALVRSGVTPADTPEEFRHKLRGEFEPLLDGAYDGWAAEARRLGVPLTILILPRADRALRSPRLLAMIHRLADRHGIPTIDLSDAFAGLTAAEFRVSAWDMHPSVLGHRAILDALRVELSRPDGLPASDARRRPAATSRMDPAASGR